LFETFGHGKREAGSKEDLLGPRNKVLFNQDSLNKKLAKNYKSQLQIGP
jgi:hypothetical protein